MNRIAGLLFGLLLLGAEVPAFSSTAEVSPFPEDELKKDPAFDEATYRKLQSLPVEVSWDKDDLATVLADLTAKTQKADPTHKGIRFVFAPSEIPGEHDGRRKVSVLLMGVPILAVLEYLSEQAHFQIRVEKDSVLVQTLPLR
jgi:hypothetical protein